MKKSTLIFFIFATLLSSCSKSDEEVKPVHSTLTSTKWIKIEYYSSGSIGYELFEFTTSEDFTLSEISLNGIKERYLLIGKYRQEEDKVICTYEPVDNPAPYYKGSSTTLIINKKNNTLYFESFPKGIYVKQ